MGHTHVCDPSSVPCDDPEDQIVLGTPTQWTFKSPKMNPSTREEDDDTAAGTTMDPVSFQSQLRQIQKNLHQLTKDVVSHPQVNDYQEKNYQEPVVSGPVSTTSSTRGESLVFDGHSWPSFPYSWSLDLSTLLTRVATVSDKSGEPSSLRCSLNLVTVPWSQTDLKSSTLSRTTYSCWRTLSPITVLIPGLSPLRFNHNVLMCNILCPVVK